jgi:hypothetical protein
VDVLRAWKVDAEAAADRALGKAVRADVISAASATLEIVACDPDDGALPEDDERRRLWTIFHLTRICGDSQIDLDELRGALGAARAGITGLRRWPNGETARIGEGWYYPNGQNACIGSNWYYPNGQNACIGSGWYYPNGQNACIGSNWYFPTGDTADSEASLLGIAFAKLSTAARLAVAAGLPKLRGQPRRLALVELGWLARSPTSSRGF